MVARAGSRPAAQVQERSGWQNSAEARRSGKQWRKPAIAFGERLFFREVGEGVRVLKEGRYVGHHGRTGSLMLMTSDRSYWMGSAERNTLGAERTKAGRWRAADG